MAFLGMSLKFEGEPPTFSGVEVLKTDWSKGWISKNDLKETSTRLLSSVPEEGEAFQSFSCACGDRADYNSYMKNATLVYAFLHMKYFKPTNSWDHMTPGMWEAALLDAVRALNSSRSS
jgi:hypothetical protein